LVFNGEIYNFRELRCELESKGHSFRSRTDTEVILAAYREWGVECLSRFNGMFAFGLYDIAQGRLFLARDRVGEKPLYYCVMNGVLRFASELKALLADPVFPRCVDLESLDCYLAFGFVPGERCILRGVKKLPPAHALVFEKKTGRARVWRYWDLPPPPDGCATDEVALVDELEHLLADAVGRQLVADVPVGVLLSGGMDSSLVTAMAVRGSRRVKTFTVRFPGYGPFDETEHARLVAQHFQTEQVELDATDIKPEVLLRLARQFDEPIVDSSMVPTSLVCGLVRQHCTVALGGDGGDELFGGYPHYQRLVRLQRYFGWIPLPLRRAVAAAATVALPVGLKGRNWLQALEVDFRHSVPCIASYFDRYRRARLLDSIAQAWPLVGEGVREEAIHPSGDLVERATRADFRLYLAEDILPKVDRASMLHSLEVRAPFLDYRIVEFAFGRVPSRLKANAHERKIFLKKLAARALPAGFDKERKQGFSLPLASWLRTGPWLRFFREVLLEADHSIFDRGCVQSLFGGQAGRRSNSERLFALVLFELWRREYGVTL
jgi:asparagine synthase (glutamine-hydrolysing)